MSYVKRWKNAFSNNELISHTQWYLFIRTKHKQNESHLPFSSLPYQFNVAIFFLNDISNNNNNNDDKMLPIFGDFDTVLREADK